MIRRFIEWLFGPQKPFLIRSAKWPEVSARWLKLHPECAVCGSRKNVIAHHVVPVHVDPERELDEDNLLTLCEGKVINCHLLFGHVRDYRSWNENVRWDARVWKDKIKNRPYL